MRGSIGKYQKPNGDLEVRIHFPVWDLPDGRQLLDVTLFPHPCHACAGGDHTHLETNDLRPPIEILAAEAVTLSERHASALDRLLIEKTNIDGLTLELFDYVAAFSSEHSH